MSEKPKWTPGPWFCEVVEPRHGRPETYIFSREGWANSGTQGQRTVAAVGHWKDRPHPEADARLIASAPALYEALEELVAKCPACGGEGVEYGPDPGESFGPNRGVLDVPCRWCADARSALARARGEETP